ncbi:A-kinase anchor protein 17A isoform X1 [Tympanuchus pallidicinctus]|uniref:A-kinase anchor protein 17A isoform X1 n=2 Tax=Tympanuchus pallidicinctus TaxID=109042 RepID=UPI0022876FA2|nr:A-kinase anchor protein 17A isoform X1 [Tympanuchus pallidicinctus]XP_052520661.1 A-kinase anchor protein 17A isoform X1 [Tympanuchus pallidicinctus]
MAAATIVHDTSEAVELCAPCGLYLKPITKMTISVALPQLKQPGKSISNWEVMERLKGMVQTHQFSTLRISKSTMDFIRFEGEVENKSLVKSFLACLDGKTIKLSGFSDILKVRAAEYKIDFPTRHDWDSFFRDAKDMNETLPGERPDTIHLEGLPCKWFAAKDSGSEKPSEEVLTKVFQKFGEIRNVDIPMLDPYREEMTGRNFHTFSFGGHLNFEAYVQYREYAGFIKAMNALRGMKLMFKGDDGKAVACNIKVSFDSTKHLSDASIKKRQLERQKLQELEKQREEQKRREKEAEEKQREEERKQRELEEYERERKREEKLRKREQKQKDREVRRNKKQLEKLQAEEQKKLQEKIKLEERKLLLAQRNLQSIRLIAELLSRAKTVKLLEQEQNEEKIRLQQLEEKRKLQEAELRRVEEEKERALGLQRKEKELREKLLNNLLSKKMDAVHQSKEETEASQSGTVKIASDVPHTVSSSCITSTSGQAVTDKLASDSQRELPSPENVNAQCKYLNGNIHDRVDVKEGQKLHTTDSERCSEKRSSTLSCVPANNQKQNTCKKDSRCEQSKQSTEPRRRKSRSCSSINTDESKGKRERTRHRRDATYQDERRRRERRYYRHSSRSYSPRRSHSPRRRSVSPRRSHYRRTHSSERKRDRREKSRSRRSSSRKRRYRRRSLSKQRSTWSG